MQKNNPLKCNSLRPFLIRNRSRRLIAWQIGAEEGAKNPPLHLIYLLKEVEIPPIM